MQSIVLSVAVRSAYVSGTSLVKSVTGVELDQLISGGKAVFAKFYSPKCPHCVRVAPLWEELASKVTEVEVVDIDCSSNREACKRFNVQGVPSLQFIKEGKVYMYKGARDVASFSRFVTEKGYEEGGVQVSDLPGAEKIKTLSEQVVEGVSEVIQQLSAIANYSPLAVLILLGLGFLSGASVTGLVVLASKPKTEGVCGENVCSSAKSQISEKSATAKKTD